MAKGKKRTLAAVAAEGGAVTEEDSEAAAAEAAEAARLLEAELFGGASVSAKRGRRSGLLCEPGGGGVPFRKGCCALRRQILAPQGAQYTRNVALRMASAANICPCRCCLAQMCARNCAHF